MPDAKLPTLTLKEPSKETLLKVNNLSAFYPIDYGILGQVTNEFQVLKNIEFEVRKGESLGLVGESGSGKSSLTFDTIYAEGQRRYMESFSAYARSFIGDMERPDVDKIEGLSPVISIEQKTISRNPRSTVGTITEIYDFLRLLFARAGEAFSYITGEKMTRQTEDQILFGRGELGGGATLGGARLRATDLGLGVVERLRQRDREVLAGEIRSALLKQSVIAGLDVLLGETGLEVGADRGQDAASRLANDLLGQLLAIAGRPVGRIELGRPGVELEQIGRAHCARDRKRDKR